MKYSSLLLILIISACGKQHDEKLYLGELYFSPLRLGNFYNLPDSLKVRFKQSMDTLDIEKADSAQRMLYEVYQSFRSNNLLYKPFVDLRLKDSSFVKLFLDSSDYDRIKIYKRQNLVNDKKKIILWGKAKKIGYYGFPLLYCTELVNVELSEGQTFPEKQGKFKIDDYN